MQFREGAYYRTRGGDVVGPLKPSKREKLGGWVGIDYSWYEDGRFLPSGAQHHILDLISEVYVSDTPPALEVETLRDKFAGRALQGLLANPSYDSYVKEWARDAYLYADAMMEARKK